MKTKPVRSEASSSSKKKLILPLFLGGLLILSTFAIIFSGPSETSSSTYQYKDLYFRLTPQGWESTVQGQSLLLRHDPKTLESLYTDFPFASAFSLLGLEKLYISSLPPEPVQETQRDFYLNSNILPPVTFSCVEDVSGCEELPIKTCSDATATQGVLIFRLGEEDQMTVENTCITLMGNSTTSLTQMTDKLVYTLYGVF